MAATEKLYYTQPETRAFSARVLSCSETESGFEVVLDRTAFYPEGGGQPADRGTLGGAGVLDVQERGEEIVHLLPVPLFPGSGVEGRVDEAFRLDYTEQHTADHVLCGVIHRRWGYDNVGFHMGAETTTIDLSGVLEPEQLAEMEEEANAVIRADLPILERWPDPAALPALDYRSKKELSGPVRLIEIPGVDLCACCGTHLKSTGALGCLKILSFEKLRGGLRLEMVAGARAWRGLAAVFEENRRVSGLLSAPMTQTAQAVSRLLEEQQGLKAALAASEKRWVRTAAAGAMGDGTRLFFEEDLSAETMQRLCDAVMQLSSGLVGVFSGTDREGYRYAVGQKDAQLRDLVKAMNEALRGRGGGRDGFAQGRVNATESEIRAFFG